jgi:hypothetical protein
MVKCGADRVKISEQHCQVQMPGTDQLIFFLPLIFSVSADMLWSQFTYME